MERVAINGVVSESRHYEVYASSERDGKGGVSQHDTLEDAKEEARRLCRLGFNGPPAKHVEIADVHRVVRRINAPEFL